VQKEISCGTAVNAFGDLLVEVVGQCDAKVISPDIVIMVTRIDGRRMFEDRWSWHGDCTELHGRFHVKIGMHPLVLGANVFQLEVKLIETDGRICASGSRTFEVIDQEGQFGGVPMLYWPPVITVSEGFKESVK
jgi:lipopolysaccharide transport system ATP-binding protein